MIVALIRHGSTHWNETGRMQGRCDVPLSAQGRGQVQAWRLPPTIASPPRWLSSPLARAVETARILSGVEPDPVPALIEMDWGEWEGRTLAELDAEYGAAFRRNAATGLDFRPPGGESPREVRERVLQCLRALPPVEEAAVAVTHNGVIRALLSAATGWDMTGKPPVRLERDALHRFAVDDGRVALLEANVRLAGSSALSPDR
jgi:probable phosphoglycerate mutase